MILSGMNIGHLCHSETLQPAVGRRIRCQREMRSGLASVQRCIMTDIGQLSGATAIVKANALPFKVRNTARARSLSMHSQSTPFKGRREAGTQRASRMLRVAAERLKSGLGRE